MGSIFEDDDEEESKHSKMPDGRRSSRDDLGCFGSSDEGSSIDGDEDNEEKLYQQILASKANA